MSQKCLTCRTVSVLFHRNVRFFRVFKFSSDAGQKMPEEVKLPIYMKFLIAANSGVGATAVTYPLDVIKFRMQVSGEGGSAKDHQNVLYFAKHIYQNEGIMNFYNGLSASALRQFTYTGTRLGAYTVLVDYYTEKDGHPPNIWKNLFCGIVGGVLGGVVAVPCDISMTRMAIDGRQPPHLRRNYKHIFDALRRIWKEEGFLVLFRGTIPTVTRAVVVNVSQFISYFKTKELLISHGITGDTTPCHIGASISSALISTICLQPPDMAKTRMQNMTVIDGKPEYKGMFDIWYKLIKKEGILSPWKGFTPLIVRNGPMAVVLFILYENQIRLYKWYKHRNSSQ